MIASWRWHTECLEAAEELHTLVMPRLDRGILFMASKEDPPIKSGGDEREMQDPRDKPGGGEW